MLNAGPTNLLHSSASIAFRPESSTAPLHPFWRMVCWTVQPVQLKVWQLVNAEAAPAS